MQSPEVKGRIAAAIARGFQTRDAELNLGAILGTL
jgi:hypothetical protein